MRHAQTIRPRLLPPATRRADLLFWRKWATPRAPRRRTSEAPAFTLVEVVIVTIIIAILAGVGMTRYSQSLVNYRLSMAAARVLADINLTQSRARTTSSPRSITFSIASNNYTISAEAGVTSSTAKYTVDLSAQPFFVTLKRVAFQSAGRLTFDAYGMPDGGGTIQLAAGASTRTITIDAASGRASVSTP